MDDASIQVIVEELKPLLAGRAPGKIFQLGAASLAIDFGLRDQGYLLISVEPAQPRFYLIKRKVRELEKLSSPLTPFALALKKELSSVQLVSLDKDVDDRIVRLGFSGRDDLGAAKKRQLVTQLTGRSANLLLLDEADRIIQRARSTGVAGQQIGDPYQKPNTKIESAATRESKLLQQILSRRSSSPSAAADSYFRALDQEKAFAAGAAAARAELRKQIVQQQRLLKQLEQDLAMHADADAQKRLGDILLANLSTAKRFGNRVRLVDYFSNDQATVEIELDESTSLQEEASRRFSLYSRSKRALDRIQSRLESVRDRLRELESEQGSLEERIAAGKFAPPGVKPESTGRVKKSPAKIPGTRRYLSRDGFEILVGRTAQDNDQLTFKIAKPNDTWLHAADYGGSHVVIRNATRKPLPHQTLVEAAQLAAWFSQAKKDPKVDVHYTERKFVAKIKGGKPGLVRMQRFKNITVTPKEAGTRE